MTDKRDTHAKQASRRSMMKKLFAGGVMTTAAIQLPKQWAKPLVDIVLLPAHAQMSPLPEFELNVTNIQSIVPAACSGGTFPPFDITGVFSLTGCDAATILSITPSLPNPATVATSFAVGSTISNGGVFTLSLSAYPSSSQFACVPVAEAANITIEYDCADFTDSPTQQLTIEVLGTILAGQT